MSKNFCNQPHMRVLLNLTVLKQIVNTPIVCLVIKLYLLERLPFIRRVCIYDRANYVGSALLGVIDPRFLQSRAATCCYMLAFVFCLQPTVEK